MNATNMRYNVILLFGPPGSGKGTWGKILDLIPGFYHFSTGEMFRMLDVDSEIGQRIMETMRRGELVPDEITFDLWQKNLNTATLVGRFRPAKDTLVLDGFPRTPKQADMLKSVAEVKLILKLDCADRDILIERLHKRAILEGRLDDANKQVIRRRFKLYDAQIEKTLMKFSNSLIDAIDVSQPPVRILSAIGETLARRLS
ncbi:MAG: adenylate kinase [bacterium]|nr:adenylate kinase [bacterium]